MGFRERMGQMRVSRREHAFPHPSRSMGERIHLIAALLGVLFVLLTVVQSYSFHARHGFGQLPTSGPAVFPLLSVVTVCLLTIAIVVIRPGRLEPVRLVKMSVAWTVILLFALICTWVLIDGEVRDTVGIGQAVISQADVDRYLSAHALELTDTAIAPLHIPTGIFVETIEFSTANDVQISAFIWQRYGPRVPADVPRGFSVPGAVAESIDAMDSYTVTADDGTTLLGWHVHLTVRQGRDYRDFPLDRQDVSLRLWPEVPDRRVVLVPDLASYPNLDPAALPGLSREFVGGGWIAEHTFFSYGMNTANATFGFPEGATPRGFPELVFNVGLKRSFVEPFINDVLLAIVVAILLFAIVVLNAQDMDRRTRFGITTFGVLATSGTLLFTVLTKHNQIRSEVTPGQIVYIEILPMLLYITILLVAANAILLLAAPANRFKFISYEDNLLPNVVYWPALLGTLLVVTLLVFRS
jgi:hypothetical protein